MKVTYSLLNKIIDDLQGTCQDLNIILEKFKSGNHWSMNIYGFMELLSLKGIIPDGNYLIDHSW